MKAPHKQKVSPDQQACGLRPIEGRGHLEGEGLFG